MKAFASRHEDGRIWRHGHAIAQHALSTPIRDDATLQSAPGQHTLDRTFYFTPESPHATPNDAFDDPVLIIDEALAAQKSQRRRRRSRMGPDACRKGHPVGRPKDSTRCLPERPSRRSAQGLHPMLAAKAIPSVGPRTPPDACRKGHPVGRSTGRTVPMRPDWTRSA
jgi:hypothetical protein